MDAINPTPDVTAGAEVSATPAAAVDVTPAAASVDTAATAVPPTSDTPSGPARDANGRYASATPAPVSPDAATPDAQAQATADAIEEIEALLGDQPTKLRADLKFRVGKDGQEISLKDALKSPLLLRDYTRKTQQLAEQRREMERHDVEVRARGELLAQNRQRLMDAYAQGGDALAREMRHQELLEGDPEYRQRFEESEEYRVRQQMEAYEGTVATQERATNAADDARRYIAAECAKYPALDPAEIEAAYATALQAGRADLNASSVDRLIQRELQRVHRVTAPVSTELAQLKAELAALKATQTVQQHNAATAAQIGNAKAAAVGTPSAGQVPITPGLKPFNPDTDDLQEYKRRWRAAS